MTEGRFSYARECSQQAIAFWQASNIFLHSSKGAQLGTSYS